MLNSDTPLFREAVLEAKDVAGRLVEAYMDQHGRTVRLSSLTTVGVAGQLASLTLVLQMQVPIPPPAALGAGVGVAATLAALGILIVAQTNLPGDPLWSWGSTPWVYARRATMAGEDEHKWLTYMFEELDERVMHNASVVVVLVRRRNQALVWGATGMLMFLASMGYIAGGALIG